MKDLLGGNRRVGVRLIDAGPSRLEEQVAGKRDSLLDREGKDLHQARGGRVDRGRRGDAPDGRVVQGKGRYSERALPLLGEQGGIALDKGAARQTCVGIRPAGIGLKPRGQAGHRAHEKPAIIHTRDLGQVIIHPPQVGAEGQTVLRHLRYHGRIKPERRRQVFQIKVHLSQSEPLQQAGVSLERWKGPRGKKSRPG